MLTVCKFGGSSLATPERMRRAAAILADAAAQGEVVAVLSAQGDTTDELIAKTEAYSPRPPARELDLLLSTGEQSSAALMAMTLCAMGIPAEALTGWQAGVRTDDCFGNAAIREIEPGRIRAVLGKGKVAVVTGFQGVTDGADVTTLGRGGSDTTAVAVAAALGAVSCRIYTDVDGVYSADPRRVPTAKRYDEIDTGEMLRLSALGAQVLHDRCVSLARRYAMPLEVRSSFSDAPGTTVRPLPTDTPRLTAATATGSTVHLVGSRLSALPELTERATAALERAEITVKRSFADDHRLSVTVEGDAARALRVLHDALILGDG